MPVRFVRTQGVHLDSGIRQQEKGLPRQWILLNVQEAPRIPFGTPIEITISYEDIDFVNGVNGIVWGTYDRRQAEIIQSALDVQDVASETRELKFPDRLLYLLYIPGDEDVEKAIDFIWRDSTGMRLQPDWWYPAGAQNISFKKWTIDK